MKIELEKGEHCKRTLNVEVEPEEVAKERSLVLDSFRKRAEIHGFRRGKAPIRLVEAHYQSQIKEDLIERITNQVYQKALDDYRLDPVHPGRIVEGSFEDGQPFRMKLEIEVMPDVIKLADYEHMELKRPKREVTDEDVDRVIEQVRTARGTYEATDQPSKQGDMVIIDYNATIDGQPFDGGKGEGVSLILGEGRFLKDFEDQLVGKKSGEQTGFDMTFPADYPGAAVAGKQARFEVNVKEVREKHIPELNDEFVKRVFEVETLDDIKRLIREDLQREYDTNGKNHLVDTMLRKLLDDSEFELSPSLKQEVKEGYRKEEAERQKRRGVPEATVKQVLERHDESFERMAEDEMKMHALISEVAERENIEVSESELNEEIESVKQDMQRQYSLQDEAARGRLESYFSSDEARNRVRGRLHRGKIIDFLVSKATITDVDYRELQPEHTHEHGPECGPECGHGHEPQSADQ